MNLLSAGPAPVETVPIFPPFLIASSWGLATLINCMMIDAEM